MATIRTYADEADWNMTSYIMEQHQKNASGNSLMVGQMLDTFRLPKDFASMVYLSMVLQAEGIRYGVEHWRRHPDRVAGILYWQLNDCWPVASWSSLDYFGRWKALHYAARRFYAPLMLSIEDKAPEQEVYVSNDWLEPWEGTVNWSLETLEGEVLSSGHAPVSGPPRKHRRWYAGWIFPTRSRMTTSASWFLSPSSGRAINSSAVKQRTLCPSSIWR